eukprot:s1077_g2.t1
MLLLRLCSGALRLPWRPKNRQSLISLHVVEYLMRDAVSWHMVSSSNCPLQSPLPSVRIETRCTQALYSWSQSAQLARQRGLISSNGSSNKFTEVSMHEHVQETQAMACGLQSLCSSPGFK